MKGNLAQWWDIQPCKVCLSLSPHLWATSHPRRHATYVGMGLREPRLINPVSNPSLDMSGSPNWIPPQGSSQRRFMTLGNPANIDTSIRQQAYNTWPLKQTNKISAKYCMPVNCAHSRMGRCISWIGHHCWIMQWWENNPIVNSCINIALEDFWTKKVFSLWCVPRKGHFVTVNASDILKTCFIRPYIGALGNLLWKVWRRS